MTSFEIEKLPFTVEDLRLWRERDPRFLNWPVVYLLDDGERIYVGETLNTAARMRQHLDAADRQTLKAVRLVLDNTFNKSVCLDLESQLLELFAGDDKYIVMNSNKGVVNADYYDRERYRATFDEIFTTLREQELFTRSVASIRNSEMFKLSPFKALNRDQAVVMEGILEGLFLDFETGAGSTSVVQGDPGTGKTIVAVFLLKLLRDVQNGIGVDEVDGDSLFSDFFTEEHRRLLAGRRIGLVVPQQALRASLRRVFHRTPGLESAMVLTPFQVGKSAERWDLLVVDESHRLNQRANQASGPHNKAFGEINEALFGMDSLAFTQLDWIRAQSTHQILLLDSEQSVRPADLPPRLQADLVDEARVRDRYHRLFTQMRVEGGADYVSYVRAMMRGESPEPKGFGRYEFRMFDDAGEMHDAIRQKDDEFGLSRLVAGFAWEWKSNRDSGAVDIEIGGRQLQWNQTPTDWITSEGAVDQVGSIHTVQGYDLNYAGVIIGPDLRFDVPSQRIVFDRSNYFDKKGMENNKKLGITYSDEDLRRFVSNIYAVLLTRGVRGTYVHVVDPDLREHLRQFVTPVGVSHWPS